MPFGQHIADDGGLNLREQTRCKGNFVRKLYDGFGQPFQEQSPHQGWETTQNGRSTVDNQLKTVVDCGYDGLGRVTSAYGRTYAYDAASRLTSFNGQTYGYGDSGPFHAVDPIGSADRFDYDANGNMTVRNKGIAGQQTLVWDDENRLSQVQDNDADLLKQCWYDVDGARVKKVSGTTTTYSSMVGPNR